MTRTPSKSKIKRVVQAVQSLGLPISAIRVGADGSIDVRTEATSNETPDSALDEWRAKHAHETEGN
jgi:hypothetical protein